MLVKMIKKHLVLYLFIVFFINSSRLFSFGKNIVFNETLCYNDTTKSFRIFHFDENPACLLHLWQSDYFQFSSSSSNSWGNYKRRFDAEGNHVNNIGFSGQTKLDQKSVFSGESSYIFDWRSNQNRSLKYETYTGEAFFITDTTKGNFLYHGPNIGFSYCYQIIPKLSLGLNVNYNLLDGIKNNYSQAQSVIRNIYLKSGLIYYFKPSFAVGATFDYFDAQESIEAKGNGPYVVDIHNFRGDEHSVLNRGLYLFQKVHKIGSSFGAQIIFVPLKNIEVNFKGKYTNFDFKNLISESKIEDVHSNFNLYDGEFEVIYSFLSNFCLRNNFNYIYSQSWSKHPAGDFLLWKWNTKTLNNNIGLTYKFIQQDILLNMNYGINYFSPDSQKFIDNRFSNFNTVNKFYSAGFEYTMHKNLDIYANFKFEKINIDPIIGGKNLILTGYNVGSSFALNETMKVFLDLYYDEIENRNNVSLRKNFDVLIKIQVFK